MEKKIYYHDTDAGGVVYYGRYLNYFEESRTEYLEERGVLAHQDFLYAVQKCSIHYKAPARYSDIITCDATLIKLTAARMIFNQKIHNKKTGQLLVEAEVVLASLNHDFKPTPIPAEIKAKLA